MTRCREYTVAFRTIRGIKVFFDLKVGVTRSEVPNFEAVAKRDPEALQQAESQINSQRQLIEKQARQLALSRERLDGKSKRITQLQEELAESRAGRPDCAIFDGVILPPRHLRPGRPGFQDDELYLASARKDADKLIKYLGLGTESSLLDVGSGPGRLAIGILQQAEEIREYRGIDVDETSVRWGQHYITPAHPNFRFIHIDVENSRYNPSGSEADESFSFPFADGEFDIVTLYSVFTHMLADGVRAYLKEFRRMLRPGGRIYLTAFLEEGVPDVTENPQGYLGREWKGPLHCVRYNEKFFESLLDENGFRLDGFDLRDGRTEGDEWGHRGLLVSKKASGPIPVA
jgi:SAM-dependent methyltransferase